MADFRANAPAAFAGVAVAAVEDFASGEKKYADGHVEMMTLPKANVLKYLLADGSWIAVRPSGTEPKIKFYIGAQDNTAAGVHTKRQSFEKAITEFLNK